MDWGSSYPQRALHNLTYGPIAGRGTLDRNHNASCARLSIPADATHLKRGTDIQPMAKTVCDLRLSAADRSATEFYAAMIAPSGARPSVTKRQIAIKSLRAKATIVMRRIRP